MAVRFVVLFFKGAFVELLQAEGADKVLRVELLGHGGDAAARDGLLAAGAEGAAPLVVVHFTVRLAVVLKEASVHKRGEALLRTKTRERRRYSTIIILMTVSYRGVMETELQTLQTKHSGCQRLLSAEM